MLMASEKMTEDEASDLIQIIVDRKKNYVNVEEFAPLRLIDKINFN